MIPSLGQLSRLWRYKAQDVEWLSELLCLLRDCKTKGERPDGKGLQATTWIII